MVIVRGVVTRFGIVSVQTGSVKMHNTLDACISYVYLLSLHSLCISGCFQGGEELDNPDLQSGCPMLVRSLKPRPTNIARYANSSHVPRPYCCKWNGLRVSWSTELDQFYLAHRKLGHSAVMLWVYIVDISGWCNPWL